MRRGIKERRLGSDVGSNAENNYPVSGLRDAIILAAYHEVLRSEFAQEIGAARRERHEAIFQVCQCVSTGCNHRPPQVIQNLVKYCLVFDFRGQKTLDVFHDEDRRSMDSKYPKIVSVQLMSGIRFVGPHLLRLSALCRTCARGILNSSPIFSSSDQSRPAND